MTRDPSTLTVCPVDAGPLHWDEAGVTCLSCGRPWRHAGDVALFVAAESDDVEPVPATRSLDPADWRFLLPAGAHVHVLELDTPRGCSAFEIAGDVGSVVVLTDTESRAVALREEARRRRVEVHAVAAPLLSLPFAAASFDVVVAHDALARVTGPDAGAARASFVRRLIALLEPGGALWVDHDRRSAAGDETVGLPEAKRAIVNGGAIPAETFERFGRSGRELLPLDEETVSAWRDPERESRPHSRWTRWLPRARRTPDRFGILVTTARTSGAGPGRLSILARTSRAVRENWPMLALEGDAPGRLRYWLDSRDPSPSGTLSAMPFREGESRPLALVKIARDGGAAMRLRNEHGLLRQLADESPRSADVLFPRSLLVVDSESQLATVQAPVVGVAPSPEDALGAAERWLRAFWRSTGMLAGTERALLEPLTRQVGAALERTDDPEEKIRLEDLVLDLEARDGVSIAAWGHGAFTADRLRVNGDRVTAIDWEFGASRQAAWIDPALFVWDQLRIRAAQSGATLSEEATEWLMRAADGDDPLAGFLLRCLEDAGCEASVLPAGFAAIAFLRARQTERHVGVDDPGPDAWRRAGLAALAPAARECLSRLVRHSSLV